MRSTNIRNNNQVGAPINDNGERIQVDLKTLESAVRDKKNIYTLFVNEGILS